MDDKQIKQYFNPPSKRPGLILAAFGLLTFFVGTNGSGTMVFLGLLLMALGGFLLYRAVAGGPTDSQIDDHIRSITNSAMQRGMEKLGLDPEQVSMIEPVQIDGPSVSDPHQLARKGKDGEYRFAGNEVLCLYFSEHEVHCYTKKFNLLKPEIKRESTDEYFYRDIVAVRTDSDSVTVPLPDGTRKDLHQDQFRLTTSGGTSIQVGATSTGQLSDKINGMRSLIKQRKLNA